MRVRSVASQTTPSPEGVESEKKEKPEQKAASTTPSSPKKEKGREKEKAPPKKAKKEVKPPAENSDSATGRRSLRQRFDIKAPEGFSRQEIEKALRLSLEQGESEQKEKKDSASPGNKKKESPTKRKAAVQKKEKEKEKTTPAATSSNPATKPSPPKKAKKEQPVEKKEKEEIKKEDAKKEEESVEEEDSKPETSAAEKAPLNSRPEAAAAKKETRKKATNSSSAEAKQPKKTPAPVAKVAPLKRAPPSTSGESAGGGGAVVAPSAFKGRVGKRPEANDFIRFLATAKRVLGDNCDLNVHRCRARKRKRAMTCSGCVSYLHFLLSCIVCIASLLVFQGGFLLKRVQLVQKSKCEDVSLSSNACWLPPSYDRVVFILIDALRYDFLAAEKDTSKPYTGHMPFTQALVERGAFLTKAVADPPTTTLQRLKALGTGGLPTFIDASENFSSDAEVEEDNLLEQLKTAGKNATLLGDDTWLSLYPNGFKRSFALPSFDIHDLHTVDNYILEHLDSELSRRDWNLLVAHFLGVDHAGHKHGPDHPEMTAKLRQMDKVVMQVVNSLEEGTLLLVMGDHGMTSTGDHGGDSEDEVSAAFLAYAKGKNFSQPAEPISQIDLVPTLSLLLDLPIPFSSLGTVIRPLFPSELLPRLISLNAMQVERFAATYSSSHGVGMSLVLPEELPSSEREQRALIFRLQSSLRAAWTRFDVGVMRLSLFCLLDSLLALAVVPPSLASFVVRHCHLLLLLAIRGGLSSEGDPVSPLSSDAPHLAASLLTCSLVVSLLYSLGRAASASWPRLSWLELGAAAASVAHAASVLSNSFVVFEQPVLRFLLSSLLIGASASKIREKNSKTASARLHSREFLFPLSLLLASLCLLRLDPLFHRCREEEQAACFQYSPSLPSTSLPLDTRALRLLGGFTAAIFSVFLLRQFSYRFPVPTTVQIASALSLPTATLVCVHYTTSLLPAAMAAKHTTVIRLLAQVVYGTSAFSGILATVSRHRSALSVVMTSLSLPLLLLLGDGLAPAFAVLLALLLCVSHLSPSPHFLLSLLSLLLPYSFYLLGNSPTLSAIPWHAAFVGLSGSSAPRVLAASLVLCHLFAGCLLVALSLPLLLSLSSPSTLFPPLSAWRHITFLSGLHAVFSCICALLHRRHLMVWKIFAPSFIFTGVSFLLLLAVLNFSFLLAHRILVKT